MNRIKIFLKNTWFYWVAFLLPCMLAIVYLIVNGGGKLGNGSLLTGDTAQQLVPFAFDLWDKVHSGQSLQYTWNIAGGCDFSAITGYFISPFTLVMLLCPRAWIPNVMQIIMITKWAVSAVAMVYFFYKTRHNTLRENKEIVSLFLGLAFAMGTSVFNFMRYIQFGDVTICFPLLLLLLEKLVLEKRWKLYFLLLTFCIMSNAYIAWGVCLFLIIWFVMQMDYSITEKWKKFFLFASVSVMSAASTMFLILPSLGVVQNRLGVSDTSRTMNYAFAIIIDPITFLKQIVMYAQIFSPSRLEPNIFISIIGIMCVFFFPFIKIGKRKKLYMSVIFILLTASFFVGSLSLVWHLFNIPNGVYHRFSNLYSFFLLFMLLQVMIHLEEIRAKHIVIVAVVYIAVFCYTFFNIKEYSSFLLYFISVLAIALVLVILVFYIKKSISYSKMLVVISVLGTLELCFSVYMGFASYYTQNYSKNDIHMMYVANLFEEAELEKGERVAVPNTMSNVPMIASKSSASGFVSALNGYNQLLYDRLGMPVNGNVEYTLCGASPLINLMMNVRYLVADSLVECSDAVLVKEKGYYNLYETQRLAGLGYMVSDNLTEWNIYENPCFDVQNSFVELAVGADNIFDRIEPVVEAHDVEGQQLERDMEYAKNGAYVYNCKSRYGNEYDSIQLKFVAEENMDLYAFSLSDFSAEIVIYVDGEMIHDDNKAFVQSTYHIGNVKKGQEICLVAMADEDMIVDMPMTWFTRFAKFNEENYAKAYEKLSKNVYEIEQMDSDYVKGSIVAEEAGIMMTSIQAVEGFTVLVDGQETKCEVIGGSLIGVPLEKGKHIVEFIYNTPTSTMGNIISLCAIALFLIFCAIDTIRKKQKMITEQTEAVIE